MSPAAASTILPAISNEDKKHYFLTILSCANIFLLVFILWGFSTSSFLPQITPVSADTPIVRFNMVYPQENSIVSQTVPIVTTISNGPKIVEAALTVNNQQIQTLFSQETEKLTIFWDTTKVANGSYNVTISALDDEGGISQLNTKLIVQNDAPGKTLR